jgi:peptide chain release factor 1
MGKHQQQKETVVVEIRPAEGGDDAKLFTFDIFKMISAYSRNKGWEVEIVEMRSAGRHGYQDITFLVHGKGVYADLTHETGGHRVQRVPPTEKRDRRQTSTITVAVLPQPTEVEVHIDERDLEWQTFRAGGAGGQHQNKTDSAVRLIHTPTNTVVVCRDERSQHENRRKAMAVLRARIFSAVQGSTDASRNEQRSSQIGSGMRGDKVRTYNFREDRVTDHRTGKTVRDVDSILRGRLELLR